MLGALAAVVGSLAAAPPLAHARVDAFVAKEHELGCEKFRMPSLVPLDGRRGREAGGGIMLLLFVACETPNGPTAIVVKSSEDGGASWSAARLAAGRNGSAFDGTNRYCPLASAAGDGRASERVTLQYLTYGPAAECHVREVASTDRGRTWAGDRCLDRFLRTASGAAVESPSPGIALRLRSPQAAGRVLWSGHTGMGGGSSQPGGGAFFWYDLGGGYRLSSPDAGLRYYSESQLAELPTGEVLTFFDFFGGSLVGWRDRSTVLPGAGGAAQQPLRDAAAAAVQGHGLQHGPRSQLRPRLLRPRAAQLQLPVRSHVHPRVAGRRNAPRPGPRAVQLYDLGCGRSFSCRQLSSARVQRLAAAGVAVAGAERLLVLGARAVATCAGRCV